MPRYNYDCPNCGTGMLFRTVAEHKETVCNCGARATRAQGDFPTNLLPPFKGVAVLGRKEPFTSRDEFDRYLRGGWEEDADFRGDRTAISVDEFDEMMEFDSSGPPHKLEKEG